MAVVLKAAVGGVLCFVGFVVLTAPQVGGVVGLAIPAIVAGGLLVHSAVMSALDGWAG